MISIYLTRHTHHFEGKLLYLMGKKWQFLTILYNFRPFYTILDGHSVKNDGNFKILAKPLSKTTDLRSHRHLIGPIQSWFRLIRHQNKNKKNIFFLQCLSNPVWIIQETGGGGRKRLPKFKFSVKFPIGLHVILQIQIKKFENDCYLMWKIILTENPSRFNVEPLLK